MAASVLVALRERIAWEAQSAETLPTTWPGVPRVAHTEVIAQIASLLGPACNRGWRDKKWVTPQAPPCSRGRRESEPSHLSPSPLWNDPEQKTPPCTSKSWGDAKATGLGFKIHVLCVSSSCCDTFLAQNNANIKTLYC